MENGKLFRTTLRWLEIVSWRARPGPLIVRARASTPGSRKCKFSDLVLSKIWQNFYFDRKHLWKLTVKICKIWHSGKERTKIFVLIERKISVRSKQNKRENRIIWTFSESFLQNFLKIGSLVGFNVQKQFFKIWKKFTVLILRKVGFSAFMVADKNCCYVTIVTFHDSKVSKIKWEEIVHLFDSHVAAIKVIII